MARAWIERSKQLGDGLGRSGGIETDETDGRAAAEDRDHDRVVIDRIHENVTSIALMIESIELHLANSARQFLGGSE